MRRDVDRAVRPRSGAGREEPGHDVLARRGAPRPDLGVGPLRTGISDHTLWVLASTSIAAATAIGVYACFAWTWWLAPFVVAGAFIVVAYNRELFGGAFHSTLWFALAWGSLPALAAYVVEAETLRAEAVAAAVYAALFSYAQRVLSTPARAARRGDGTVRPELETALKLLAAASVAVAAAVLLVHL